MNLFLQSTSGRLMSFSLAFGLIGGGVSIQMSAPASLYVLCASTFLPIVGCVAALQLAVDEHEYPSVLSVIALPFLLFLYAVGLGVSAKFHPSWSYGFIALGIGVLVACVRSFVVEKRDSSPSPAITRAHAAEH